MNCRFKTDRILIAVKGTKHTVTMADGKTIHKKLESNPLKFQPSKKIEKKRKPRKRCTRCGRFSNDELYKTHKRIMAENKKHDDQNIQASSSKTFPTMPAREAEEIPDITIISDSQSTTAGEAPTTVNADSELTVTDVTTYPKGEETKLRESPPDCQTPMVSSPVGCRTERTHQRNVKVATQPQPDLHKSIYIGRQRYSRFKYRGSGSYRNHRGRKGGTKIKQT